MCLVLHKNLLLILHIVAHKNCVVVIIALFRKYSGFRSFVREGWNKKQDYYVSKKLPNNSLFWSQMKLAKIEFVKAWELIWLLKPYHLKRHKIPLRVDWDKNVVQLEIQLPTFVVKDCLSNQGGEKLIQNTKRILEHMMQKILVTRVFLLKFWSTFFAF